MSDLVEFLRRALRRGRYASGGVVYAASPDDDRIPALLSPGRSTQLRPSETHVEAMARLMEGEDL